MIVAVSADSAKLIGFSVEEIEKHTEYLAGNKPFSSFHVFFKNFLLFFFTFNFY